MIGADDDFILIEGIEIALLNFKIERFCLQDTRREKEFIKQLLIPLFAEAGRYDNEKFSFPFCPLLRKEDACFNSFTEADLVSENRPFGERRTECEQCCFHLMGVEVNLGVRKRSC